MRKLIEALRISVHLLAVRPFLKFFFRSRTLCRYRLRGKNQYIIIANHNSHLDTLLIFSSLPLGQIPRTRPVAAREYFQKNRVLYWLAGFLFNPVWIDRNEKDTTHQRLDFLKNQVNAGFSLILFPEGTRGLPGRIGKFKTGIGRLTRFFPHMPIVPVYLSGPERAFPKGSRFPLPCRCRIFIGPVQYFSHTAVITTLLMESHLKQMAYYFASSKRRSTTHRQPTTIAVLGIDGSGKSTVSKKLAMHLAMRHNTAFIGDRLEHYRSSSIVASVNTLLESFRVVFNKWVKRISNHQKYKSAKICELLIRDKSIRKFNRSYCPRYTILDGSPLLNLVSWSVLYNTREYTSDTCLNAMQFLTNGDENSTATQHLLENFPELAIIKRLHLNHMNLPDKVVLLDVPPETAMKRIRARGEKIQEHESPEQLEKLRSAYKTTCTALTRHLKIPVIKVRGLQTPDNTVNLIIASLENLNKEEFHA